MLPLTRVTVTKINPGEKLPVIIVEHPRFAFVFVDYHGWESISTVEEIADKIAKELLPVRDKTWRALNITSTVHWDQGWMAVRDPDGRIVAWGGVAGKDPVTGKTTTFFMQPHNASGFQTAAHPWIETYGYILDMLPAERKRYLRTHRGLSKLGGRDES